MPDVVEGMTVSEAFEKIEDDLPNEWTDEEVVDTHSLMQSIELNTIEIPMASVTNCAFSTPSVCATAIASSDVFCGVNSGVRHCTGGTAVGGHGNSPIGLPGHVNWNGGSSCSHDCFDFEFASDSVTWPGFLGSWGAGSEEFLDHPTESKWLRCVSYGVSGSATASAHINPPVAPTLPLLNAGASQSDGAFDRQC